MTETNGFVNIWLKKTKRFNCLLINNVLITFGFTSINYLSMLSMIIGSGANIFILIVVIIIGIITGISVTDILKTEEKSEE